MVLWRRIFCVLTILAGGGTLVANSTLMLLRSQERAAFSDQLRALQERRKQIESLDLDDGSKLRYERASSLIDREEIQLYAERTSTLEWHVINHTYVILLPAIVLFVVWGILVASRRGAN